MKRLEQLARKEVAKHLSCDESARIHDLAERLYQAGFRAAQKAVLKLMDDSGDGDWDFLKFKLKRLGEEDVSEPGYPGPPLTQKSRM